MLESRYMQAATGSGWGPMIHICIDVAKRRSLEHMKLGPQPTG